MKSHLESRKFVMFARSWGGVSSITNTKKKAQSNVIGCVPLFLLLKLFFDWTCSRNSRVITYDCNLSHSNRAESANLFPSLI